MSLFRPALAATILSAALLSACASARPPDHITRPADKTAAQQEADAAACEAESKATAEANRQYVPGGIAGALVAQRNELNEIQRLIGECMKGRGYQVMAAK